MPSCPAPRGKAAALVRLGPKAGDLLRSHPPEPVRSNSDADPPSGPHPEYRWNKWRRPEFEPATDPDKVRSAQPGGQAQGAVKSVAAPGQKAAQWPAPLESSFSFSIPPTGKTNWHGAKFLNVSFLIFSFFHRVPHALLRAAF